MKTLIEFNYRSTTQRGLITNETTIRDFIMKLEEECQEFIDAALHEKGDFNEELSDIILVCLNISKHYGVDIEMELLNKVLKNFKRND